MLIQNLWNIVVCSQKSTVTYTTALDLPCLQERKYQIFRNTPYMNGPKYFSIFHSLIERTWIKIGERFDDWVYSILSILLLRSKGIHLSISIKSKHKSRLLKKMKTKNSISSTRQNYSEDSISSCHGWIWRFKLDPPFTGLPALVTCVGTQAKTTVIIICVPHKNNGIINEWNYLKKIISTL